MLGSSISMTGYAYMLIPRAATSIDNGDNLTLLIWSGTSLSWYNNAQVSYNDGSLQFNYPGDTYHYIAIG